jgi:hypothetical protein
MEYVEGGWEMLWFDNIKAHESKTSKQTRADALARQNCSQRQLKPSSTSSHIDQFNVAFLCVNISRLIIRFVIPVVFL